MDVKIKLDSAQYTWTSAAQSIYAMLQYTEQKDLTLAEVMGYSTHAFRMNIHPETVSPAGPTMFDPFDLVSLSLETLGIATITYNHPAPIPDKSVAKVIRFIQSRIDTGVPVITWDIFLPEFGLFYGYDHDKQILYAKDAEKDGVIKYSELNERRFNHIFICGFQEHRPTSQKMMLKSALKRILEHADGNSFYAHSPEYKHGLAGYEAWIKAFEGRTIDPFGNAYNSAVISDARHFAQKFFTELRSKWEVNSSLDQQVVQLMEECEHIYGSIAECLSSLPKMFPFPQGGDPNEANNGQVAINILKDAYDLEIKGVELLRHLFVLVNEFDDDTFMSPKLWHKTLEFIGEKHSGRLDFDEEVSQKMRGFLKRQNEIVTRLLDIEIIASKCFDCHSQENKSFVTAIPVSMKPDHVPVGMEYFKETANYAFIRAHKHDSEEARQRLEQWIQNNDYEKDTDRLSIEYIRYAQDPGSKDEIEIYIPVK
ncbi:hypothetical protein ACLIA0_05490 [Bacillaceae bacterium W0354]